MRNRKRIVPVFLLMALVISIFPAAAFPSQASAAACYHAQFVADVTVPDGTNFLPNTTFKKTWRLRNIGDCAWNGVTMVFNSGAQMGSTASVAVTNGIAPGQTVDVSVDMTTPNAPGHYIGYWKFKSEQGTVFGIGTQANKAWWVEIRVVGTPTGNVAYDFVAKAGEAKWSSGAGNLPFPGSETDSRGYALTGLHWIYEDYSSPQSSMLVAPQNITNGFIQGVYPEFTVERGDTFQTQLGCELQATSCYVQFRLAYQKELGPITTLFQFNEKWEGLTKPASFKPVNLDMLAGQKVKFYLVLTAFGSPIGDRALWGNPVIVRKGGVPPPTVTGTPPTSTPTKTPLPITVTVPPSSCDKVQFIADVTVPDGTTFAPGAAFTKTWRLKNVGSCPWTTAYQLAFFSGAQMGAATSAAFPKNVAVGETVDISINLTAPNNPDSYRGFWMFKNANGALFGIGAQANKPWWVDIRVSGPTVTPSGPTKTPTATPTPGPTITPIAGSVYDFAANACSGTWFTGAGQLPCPGTDGDAKGFVLKVSNPKLETGATESRPGILAFPQNVQNGYIQGFFPPFKVQNGDRFRSLINCEGGATNCYVAFRLDYQSGSDPILPYWGPFLERYEGQAYNIDIDLSQLAGKDVKFILTTLAAGTASGDRSLWVGPHIYRPTGTTSQPDLTISQLRIELQNTSCYTPGDLFGVRVGVTNNGQAAAGSFNVKVAEAQQSMSGLAIGETKQLFFPGYTNPVTAAVDPGNAVAESNEQNNSRSENLPVPTAPLPCTNPTSTLTPVPSAATQTQTPTPAASVYQNTKYNFKFTLPTGATVSNQTDTSGRVDLQFTTGTNLNEKYLQVSVAENVNPCISPAVDGGSASSENVTINNIQFVKTTGQEGAAGNIYDWVAYSTTRNNACISLAFILHSINPGNFPSPPPVFDKNAESAVFTQIINTFNWITP
ncbi:MAG TPA: NBR1-Ig-like domain-containing protein [Anaerolineales bacterium]|nr:NBR1-Ig-like domain-containing protein [Anaerolineales bacterium]